MGRRNVVDYYADRARMAAHDARYLGESAIGRAAYRCDRCGAHWYPEMGERPPADCHPTPDYLRRVRP